MNEIGELDWVLDEENGSVVSDHVVIAFLSVELHSEAAGVSLGVGRSELSSHSRESNEHGSPLANGIEELGLAELGYIVGNLKVSMSACSLGVDDSFRNSLSVKLGELIDKVEVLEEDGASGSSSD